MRRFEVMVHRILWGMFLTTVTCSTYSFLIDNRFHEAFRQSFSPAGFLFFLLLPFGYWEAFCRFTPPPKHVLLHLVNSVGRCLMVFLPSNILLQNGIISLRPIYPVLRAQFSVRWWPSVFEVMAFGVPFGGVCVIAFDFWLSKQMAGKRPDLDSAEPGTLLRSESTSRDSCEKTIALRKREQRSCNVNSQQ